MKCMGQATNQKYYKTQKLEYWLQFFSTSTSLDVNNFIINLNKAGIRGGIEKEKSFNIPFQAQSLQNVIFFPSI